MSQKPKLILGDNPFFGINHQAGSQHRESVEVRANAASEVMTAAVNSGIDTLMLTSSEEARQLLTDVYLRDDIAKNLRLALVIPNPHMVNDAVARKGLFGGVIELLKSCSPTVTDFMEIFRSRRGIYRFLISLYIRSEISSFTRIGAQVDFVCLHNVVCDLVNGLGNIQYFQDFIFVAKRIGVKPVIISQNPISFLSDTRLKDYILCFSYNTKGYMVNPSLEEVRAVLKSYPETDNSVSLWAMQVLASGVVDARQAFGDEYLANFDGVLYATTKKERVYEVVSYFEDGSR